MVLAETAMISPGNTIITPVQKLIDELHEQLSGLRDGEVATYIPELSNADPQWFGIAAVTLDGHEYVSGDVDVPFTIQSISKPFVYGLALECAGPDRVLGSIGLEPTGDAFNAISLDPASGTPANPMINAGAIATTGLVLEMNGGDPLDRVLRMLSLYAGHQVEIDDAVYRSERDTGHRNRAISHLLRGSGIVAGSPETALDLYFKQCSASVTCRDLARMAATLANNGLNPSTRQRALDSRHVESVLSVMGSCGMYDYAGEWIYRVGMPAKSGVSGGLLAVLPGQLGIGVFSPRLDERGNSARGVAVCERLSRAFSLHMFHVPDLARSVIRSTYDGSAVISKRRRPAALTAVLADASESIRVYELQGEFAFAAAEALSRDAVAMADSFEVVAFDFRHVDRIESGAEPVLSGLLSSLLEAGKQIVLSDVAHLPELSSMGGEGTPIGVFTDRDRALEWCESQILRSAGLPGEQANSVPLADNELCRGLDIDALDRLEAVLSTLQAEAGVRIISAGDQGDSILLLKSGDLSVTIDVEGQLDVRLATLSAGMAFGEMAILGESIRTANVTADTHVEYWELGMDAFEQLTETCPEIRGTIMENIARNLAARLRQANTELQALSR